MRRELLAELLDRVTQPLQPVVEVLGRDHVTEGQADAGDLAGEELRVGLRALGHAAVGLGLGPVPQLLAVLGQQDQRGGVGGLGGEGQVQQDERVRVPPQGDDDDVDEDPDGDDDGLDDEEAGGAEVAGDGLAELAEGVGVVVDAEAAAGGGGDATGPRRDSSRADPFAVARWRQSAGSVRSSTSSTVMAPSSRRCSSHTATASRLYDGQPLGHLPLGHVGQDRRLLLEAAAERSSTAAPAAGAGSARRRGRSPSAPRTARWSRRPARRSTPATPGRGPRPAPRRPWPGGPRMITSGVISEPAVPSA